MWVRIVPLLLCSDGQRGRPFREQRQVVEGIVYGLRTAVPWRGLPLKFGLWQTVWCDIATRYDKHAVNYRGGVVLGAIVLWLRPLGDTP